ncbi:type III-B CRISPR module-associated protein Cmr5 [Halomonas qaidamensis]|uniref:CRISPR type III-B/RAMP module-associated protein Cmr5 n=1 Tax=Halomonas qaidamensis TaxID=2866211 RepID=A0ABY6JQC2_9GAMM|nr:type III-B CRISPR module-associated protein Cmr5 [Halomonas qaidamensis]UYV19463.1 type III-B CRISPR module-associated protein Cmr5 [Halomonas qaidamensis]
MVKETAVVKETPISSARVPSAAGSGDIRLIEQRRAKFALQRIEDALAKSEDGKYRHSQLKSFLRRLPAMIQMNGFGQALAFYYAKRTNYEAYGVVYKLLEDWLCAEGQVYAGAEGFEYALYPQSRPHLLHELTSRDQYHYRRAEAEAQALLAWAKKFAEALILSNDDVEDD